MLTVPRFPMGEHVPARATLSCPTLKATLETANGNIVVGPESLKEKGLSAKSLLVGRQAATADLRIQHKSISRQHAILYYRDEKLCVKDLGGKHGTTINDSKIRSELEVELNDGDRIQFGNVRDSIFTVNISRLQSNLVDRDEVKQEEGPTVVKEDPSEPGAGLTGRAKREAELAAMMASLDDKPTYQTYQPPAEPETSDDTMALAKKLQLPIQHTFRLQNEGNERNSVTAIAMNKLGSRFAVGTSDNCLRLYDFSGMSRGRQESFRSITPAEGHWPVSCSFSTNGDRILVGTNSVQPVVLDREGGEVIKFVRGDMYVTDQAKTSGHTSAVTAVDWHPLEQNLVLTGSSDGSARLWDLNGKTQFEMLVCNKVFSIKSARGQRTVVTAARFHPAGIEFVVGTKCGTIQIWNRTRVSQRPERMIANAHGEGNPISSVVYNVDGALLASRSIEDNAIKVWEAKKLSRSYQARRVCLQASTTYDNATLDFSPDSRFLCVASPEGKSKGAVAFYDLAENKKDLIPVVEVKTSASSSPIIVRWHPKLNQILIGCSDGQTIVLYDSLMSRKGAVVAASRLGRVQDEVTALLNSRAPTGSAGVRGDIITPNSLPMYSEDTVSERKRKREDRKDPMKSHEPQRPAHGKHKIGSVNSSGGTLALQIADKRALEARAIAGQDPRESLFKYQKKIDEERNLEP